MAGRKITYQIDVDEHGAVVGTRKVKGEFKELDQSANRLKSSLSKVGAVAAGAAAAGLGIALSKAITRSIDKGTEFETKLADLSALTGITGKRLSRLGDRSIELSKKYGSAAADIVEANKLVASQLAQKIDFNTEEGFQQLQKVSEQAVVLQKAAGISLQDAVQATAGIINQFNLSAEEAGKVVNNLAASSKFGAAEVPFLTQAMINAGTAAYNAGQSLGITNAAIEELAAKGQQAETAGRSLRAIFTFLQTRTKELAEVGISGVNIKTDGLIKTLKKLRPILKNTTALSKIFGQENINQIQILIRNADAIEELSEKTKDTSVATDQAKTQMNTFQGAVDQLSAAIDGNLIKSFEDSSGAGVRLIHVLTDITESVGFALDSLNSMLSRSDRIDNIIGEQDWMHTLFDFTSAGEAGKQLDEMIDKTRHFADKIRNISAEADVYKKKLTEVPEGSAAYKSAEKLINQDRSALRGLRGELEKQIDSKKLQIKAYKESGVKYGLEQEQLRELKKRYQLVDDAVKKYSASLEEQAAKIQKQIDQAPKNSKQQKIYKAALKEVNEQIEQRDKKQKESNETDQKSETHVKGLTAQIKAQKEALDALKDKQGQWSDADTQRAQSIQGVIEKLKAELKFRSQLAKGGASAAYAIQQKQNQQFALQPGQTRPQGNDSFKIAAAGESMDPRIEAEKQLQNQIAKTTQKRLAAKDIALGAGQEEQKGLHISQQQWKGLSANIGQAASQAVQYSATATEAIKNVIEGTINQIIAFYVQAAIQSALGTGPAALFVAPAMTAVATAAAKALTAPLLDFERGGLLRGPSHARGGIPVMRRGRQVAEAEGGEAFINRRATAQYYDLLSAINESTGGARFPGAASMNVPIAADGGALILNAIPRNSGKNLPDLHAPAGDIAAQVARGIRQGLADATLPPVRFSQFDKDYKDYKNYKSRTGN